VSLREANPITIHFAQNAPGEIRLAVLNSSPNGKSSYAEKPPPRSGFRLNNVV
jgi:hypothetical protein